jgi:Zn finger protein HypA/HybF involved in hydrogenase expression
MLVDRYKKEVACMDCRKMFVVTEMNIYRCPKCRWRDVE